MAKLSLSKIYLSLLGFFLLWTIMTDEWGDAQLLFGTENTQLVWGYDVLNRLIWAMLAIVLLFTYRKEIPVTLKQLFTNKSELKPFLLAFIGITIYSLIAMFLNYGRFRLNPEFFFWQTLIKYLTVGFVEELVYRGWAMNAFSKFWPFWKANLVSTFFFILIHFPRYFVRFYLTGNLAFGAMIGQAGFVLICGLLFGYLFHKGKSLCSPMIAHFWVDFLFVLLLQ